MIRITLWEGKGRTRGFRVSGHAGYADSGKDIVCAAVTSAVQLTANGITEILHCEPELLVEEDTVTLKTKGDTADGRAFDLLDALRLQLTILEEQYPEWIRIQIVEV